LKEALMRKKRDRKSVQMGLFHPKTKILTLAVMPLKVQQTTIRLMSRLLRQQWEKGRNVRQEGNHE